jgi:hypothetical protein
LKAGAPHKVRTADKQPEADNGAFSMKRQRGRGRRPGGGHQHGNHGNNPNRPMESNGPENTKVRGPASLVFERYLQYARDAASSGDRVLSENYLQHADHYFRLVRMMQPAMPAPVERFDGDGDYEGGDETASADAAQGEANVAEAEADEGREGPEHAGSDQPRGDGDFRRRRGRRNRFRPNNEGGDGDAAEARSRDDFERPERDRAERPERERPERAERRERAPRERDRSRDEQPPEEGFSNGPRPAFLRSD